MIDGMDGFSAPRVLVYGIAELFLYRHSIHEIADHYGISVEAVGVIVDLKSHEIADFCSISATRQACTLKVDYKLATELALSLPTFNDTQLDKLQTRYDEYMQTQKSFKVAPKLLECKAFTDSLYSVLSSIHDEKNKQDHGIPPELIIALHDMKNVLWPLYMKYLVVKEAIRLHADRISMDYAIASLKARVRSRRLVVDLVRAGADYPFIQKYNGVVSIEVAYYQQLRRSLAVSAEREKLTTKIGIEIWGDYKKLASTGLSVVDLYFELFRRYKVRIETIYSYIQETIETESILDDDDDDDDFNELVSKV